MLFQSASPLRKRVKPVQKVPKRNLRRQRFSHLVRSDYTATVSRKLGLLERKQNDRKTVEELDGVLRLFDPSDPVRYDYGLFGLGVEGY
jgi:hypothetical protein